MILLVQLKWFYQYSYNDFTYTDEIILPAQLKWFYQYSLNDFYQYNNINRAITSLKLLVFFVDVLLQRWFPVCIKYLLR